MFHRQLRFADLMRSGKARTIGPCKHFLPHHPTPPPNISHAFDVLLSSLYPSHFFSIFDMDKLVKNHQHNWEECFKIRKLPCLNVICGTKIWPLKVVKFYRRLYSGGHKLAPNIQ